KYAVVLDAGSSGTRAHIYRWLDHKFAQNNAGDAALRSLPAIHTKRKWTKKIRPGISSFAQNPDKVGSDHLQELLAHISNVVPSEAIHDTPIFILATAGMRLLPYDDQKALLDNICSYVRSKSDLYLPDCSRSVQIIDGSTEGLYGWLATNYLLGSFNAIEPHRNGSAGGHTYGFLDMGGASAQIAFEPTAAEAEKDPDDLTLLRLRTLDGASLEHRVFTTSWLGYGVHQARDRYLNALLSSRPPHQGSTTTNELEDPCLPAGFVGEHHRIETPSNSTKSSSQPLHIVGTGNYDACLRKTYPLLEKNVPCPEEPCLVHGVHVPSIDFEVNHFIGISEWWHTTQQVFRMSHDDNDTNNDDDDNNNNINNSNNNDADDDDDKDHENYNFSEYQKRLAKFCSTPWDEIKKGVEEHKYIKKVDFEEASEICFKASWLVNLLHEGIGVPRVGIDRQGDGDDHNNNKNAGSNSTSASTTSKHASRLDTFKALNKIGSTEITWTLGKAVLVASSDVPTVKEKEEESGREVLPVGFGSNVPGVPEDFQFPGPTGLPRMEDNKHWHDRLFDVESPRRMPGFFLFVLILLIGGFYMLGKDRRRRLLRRFTSSDTRNLSSYSPPSSRPGRGVFGGKILPFLRSSSSYPEYERVLEEGLQDFELSDVHSNSYIGASSSTATTTNNKNNNSNDNDSNANSRPPRLPSPRPSSSDSSDGYHVRQHLVNDSSARSSTSSSPGHKSSEDIDRRGLVIRTESSDHVPSSLSIGSTNIGRKSRGASPIRRASSRSPP
ncbi:Golgi apyrase, partial [Ascosphaera aggregata]